MSDYESELNNSTMARGKGLRDGSYSPKIAAFLLIVGLLFHLISFGAPHWAKTNENRANRKEHIGLWRYCTYPIGGGETCSDFIDIITGGEATVTSYFLSGKVCLNISI